MHRDTVIGIVGVVILVAAMVGVFSYERNQAATGLGDGVGTLATVSGPGTSDTTAVGEVTETTLDLNTTGMTNVTFTLSWTAQNGANTMQLVVVAPDNTTTESDPESDGSIEVVAPVGNTAASGTNGVGTWRISVQFVSADSGLPAQPPPPLPVAPDSSVNWELETSIEAYTTEA